MSQALIAKIRAARQSSFVVDGRTFLIRRLTVTEFRKYLAPHPNDPEKKIINIPDDHLRNFVSGWSGFYELDFSQGGTADEVPFNADLLMEWIQDSPTVGEKILNEVSTRFLEYATSRAESEKNS